MTHLEKQADPRVSVIVPARNEYDYIECCLQSILDNEYPRERLEIIVVDGMSSDGTQQLVVGFGSKYDNVKLINNLKKNTPSAMNIGIQESIGDIIIILGAHSWVKEDFIEESVRNLQAKDAVGVGGPVQQVGNGYIGEVVSLVLSSPFGVGNSKFKYSQKEQYVDTIAYGAYRREIFDKVGLFDESLVRNQDLDLNKRIRKSGGKLFLTPAICSYHQCPSSAWRLAKLAIGNGYWAMRTVGTISIRHFVPFAFILSLLVSGGLALFTEVGKVLLGIVGGSYLLGALLASAKIGLRKGLRFIPILPLAFFTMHFSYGLGSLWAILTVWRFGAKEESKED